MKHERDIQAEIREGLGLEPDLVLWRNTVGQTMEWNPKTHERRKITYGLAIGSADLVGILGPSGRFFALEVKAPGKKAEPLQRVWAQLVRNRGGFCATVCSLDEARQALARARKGASE